MEQRHQSGLCWTEITPKLNVVLLKDWVITGCNLESGRVAEGLELGLVVCHPKQGNLLLGDSLGRMAGKDTVDLFTNLSQRCLKVVCNGRGSEETSFLINGLPSSEIIQRNDAVRLTEDRIVTVFVGKVQFLEHMKLGCKMDGNLLGSVTKGSSSSWGFNQDSGVAMGHKECLPMDG